MKSHAITALAVLFSIVALFVFSAPAIAESPDEIYSFADHLKNDGMFEAAAQQFLKFARENPVDRRAPLALERAAECLVEAGNVENAITVLETLTKTYPRDSDQCKIKIQLGRLYYKLERYESAERVYTDVVVTMPECPKVPEALLGKGEALIALKKFKPASEVLSSLVENFLESAAAPRASYHLAFCLRQLGRDVDALNKYQQICQQFPGDPLAGFASLEAARMHAARGDSTAAVNYYNNARRFEAKVFFVPASEEGAAVLDAIGQHARALAWYEEMLARPDLEDPRVIHIKAVRAAYNAKDFDGVRRIAEDYKTRYPKTFSPQITFITAMVGLERGEYDVALSDADAVEAFAPGTEWARRAPKVRGEALLAMGRPREAIGELRRFVSLGADSLARVQTLGKIADIQFSVTRDTTGALNTMTEILEVERRAIPSELLRVGGFYERLGRFKQSRMLYQDLIDRYPLSDEAETAETRVDFLDEFTVTDYAAAAAALDRTAYEMATMESWEALLRLVEARIDILKDFDSGLGLCKQIKNSSKKTAHYPRVLYLEGLGHAMLARKAHFVKGTDRAQNEMKDALKPWKELTDKHGGSAWAAKAAFQQILLRSVVAGDVDTVAVRRVLAKYPSHQDAVLLVELLGDYFASLEGRGANATAERYFKQALATKRRGTGDARVEFKAAMALSKSGKHKDAVDAFKKISESGESRLALKAAYEAGKALRQLKRYGEAVEYFDKVSDGDPRGAFGANAMLQAADCLYLQKDFTSALARYERAGRRAPSRRRAAEIAYRSAMCLTQLGRNKEAVSRLEKCLEEPLPANLRPRAYEQAANLARKLGDSERELRILEAYVGEVKAGDAAVSASKNLVRLYLRQDKTEMAGALAERLSRSAPKNDYEAKALLAMAYYRQGRQDRAKRLADEVAKNSGDAAESLAGEIAVEAAKYHYEQKSYGDAVASVSVYAEKCSGTEVCEALRYHYALSLFGANELERGSAVAQAFFREFPLSTYGPMLHLKMGNVLARENRTSESLLHYEEAATTTADSATAFLALKNLGVSYQKLKRWQDAERVWVRVLNRFASADYAREAAMNIGRCKMEYGDYNGAIATYEKSLPLLDSESKARAFYWMGTSYEQLGDFQSAVIEYLKVPFLHPGEGLWVVTAQLKAAECYAKIDRGDAAREIYNKVIGQYGASSNWGKLAQKGIDDIESTNQNPAGGGSER